MGDQDDLVAEEGDVGASGHQAFLEFEAGIVAADPGRRPPRSASLESDQG
jgi:hypothetical protein